MIQRTEPFHIVIVEDSEDDYYIIQRAFVRTKQPVELTRYASGSAMVEAVQSGECKLPDIILLDLNLPGMHGKEVLRFLRQHEQWKGVPIVMMTTSTNPDDVVECYNSGASSYMRKAIDLQQFMQMIESFCQYWFKTAILPPRN